MSALCGTQYKVYLEEIFNEKIEILDTYHRDGEAPEDANRVWYLGRSIMDMYNADLIVFVRDWERGNGCVIEHEVADMYNLNYIEVPM